MFKYYFLFVAFILLCFQLNLYSETTSFKFCFWPNAGIPLTEEVDGGCIGFITYGKVEGIDIGIVSLTKDVTGGKIALITNGKTAKGIELGIANFQREMSGFQAGIYNRSTSFRSGAQLGIVNKSNNSGGMQFGIINIMKNGFTRIFPLFNFPSKWLF